MCNHNFFDHDLQMLTSVYYYYLYDDPHRHLRSPELSLVVYSARI